MWRNCLILGILLQCTFLGRPGAANAHDQPAGRPEDRTPARALFLFSPDRAVPDAAADAGVIPPTLPRSTRWRSVEVNPALLGGGGVSVGDAIRLNPFPDAAYLSRVDSITTDVNGTTTVRARLYGGSPGYLLISTTAGRSLGSIHLPGMTEFVILPHDRSHLVLELAPKLADYVEEGPSLIAPARPDSDRATGAARGIIRGPYDPATIGVMVVYTPAALSWATSNGGISNIIAQALAKAQLTLDNSNTVASMVLVHSAQVDYSESGSSATDLQRLTYTTDGYMDQVHAWRDAYGADLVTLFEYVQDVGGVSWLLDDSGGAPDYGFSLVRVQQAATSSYTHIHEMGHTMGLHHHKQQNYQAGPGLFIYSAGWRWQSLDAGYYCSVMTYSQGSYFPDGRNHTRVPHFSNPDVNYIGVATGDPTDGDNARTVREMKAVIANYRCSSTASPALTSPPDGATCQFTFGTLTWSAVPEAAGYRVRIGSSCGSGTTYDVTSPQYSYAELAPDTTYYWQVATRNSCDFYGSYSSCWSLVNAESDADCNVNAVPDECDIDAGASLDCNENSVPDECDLAGGASRDCNANAIPDECDIGEGLSLDCNLNGAPDECDLTGGASLDCNTNAIPDECDLSIGASRDCNVNGVPDECEPGLDCAAVLWLGGVSTGGGFASSAAYTVFSTTGQAGGFGPQEFAPYAAVNGFVPAAVNPGWPPVFGDVDFDGDVDLADLRLFVNCLAGPDVTIPPPGVNLADFDRADLDDDGDVDLDDFELFQIAFGD